MTLSRQQTSLTCTFCFPKLDHVGVFILYTCVYACTSLFEKSRPLNGENKTNKQQLCILDWVSSKGGVNATDRIAAMLKCITAYWLTNIEIADLKNFMSPFLEVSRNQEQTKQKTILFLLSLV